MISQIRMEVDSVGTRNNVFGIGATNSTTIIDLAVICPNLLRQLVYILQIDFLRQVVIFKAVLQKASLDPDINIWVMVR